MIDPPLDAPPVLVALTLVSGAALGIATAIAPSTTSDATPLAAAVDRVAASHVPTTEHHATTADAIRIEPTQLTTRRGSTERTARFATGRITPVTPESRLSRVLHGSDPEAVFRTSVDFEIAIRYAHEHPPGWQHGPDRLVVRRITWGEVDVTLVGV